MATSTQATMSASTTAASEQNTGAVSTNTGASAATSSVANQVQQARMQGYEGENCNECGNFTLVRNGTCLKCNTCGSTTGCS
jgi:ribonucleoside-diphosphate reductase alpha chain